jgi:hypothetical protein
MALSLDIERLRRGRLRSECSGHLSYVGAAFASYRRRAGG